MKIDFRVLIAVACAIVVAASAVVIVRYPENSAFLVEVIAPKGVPATERVTAGLQLQVNPKGLTLSLPGCDIAAYQDKFFLHLYTDALPGKVPAQFINLDFYLAQEKGKESSSNGNKTCVYYKNFSDFSVTEATIGQFTTPNGQCCTITWSRSFVFDKRLLGG